MMENQFILVKHNQSADFVLEEQAFEGVVRIAQKVAEDVERVAGICPRVMQGQEACQEEKTRVFVATIGNSPMVDALLAQGTLQEGNLRRDREVYSFQFVEDTFYLIGSDKRGTIYGLFQLSELIGVSPLHYFGDATIVQKTTLLLEKKTLFSKQPSVEYRGFFINDEWPAFGNWATDTFGDVNAKCYEHIFELLLRLKGNYLWPAMWNSSFSEDGPGLENARLADLYGVVMGTSHHEPLCRAGNEWQEQYEKYGSDSSWNFITNAEAISAFWEDGIARNRDFENVITIGMRGECDSLLLSEDATMADNVGVLKKAILAQHEILSKKLGKPLDQVPRMLAIYKEVEQYYYGDATCEGLKDWTELEDVIFLLSDDNHGTLRALPTEEERSHKGGFGMYYHVDYHGGPISYEWVNSTQLAQIWEQMTTAYEYGVRKMWIVNVGDLKGSEYPLNYFMDMAYDYETYGLQGRDALLAYPQNWVRKQLGANLSEEQIETATTVLNGFVECNAARRPEHTNPEIYHPVHYHEGQWMIAQAEHLIALANQLYQEIPQEAKGAYESCIYYPAIASLHLHCMNVYAGYNQWLAKRGSMVANQMGEKAIAHLRGMESAVEDFHHCLQGKWNHMMQSAHTGFRTWDDNDWTYPVIHCVQPLPYPKALVGFRDHDRYHLGTHWQNGAPDLGYHFMRPETERVWLDIHSRGAIDFTYQILCSSNRLSCSKQRGQVNVLEAGGDSVEITLVQEEHARQTATSCLEEIATITVQIDFVDGSHTEMEVQLALPGCKEEAISPLPRLDANRDYLAIDATAYQENYQIGQDGFEVIPGRGRWRSSMKCFPLSKDYMLEETMENLPHLTYAFMVEQTGDYELTYEFVPTNPDHFGGRLAFRYQINDGEVRTAYGVAEDFITDHTCPEWSDGVMNHIRRTTEKVQLKAGENQLTIYPGEAGMVLERMTLLPEGKDYLDSYLRP